MKNRFKILQSPLFLIALVLLFLNDFFLKDLFPGFITGKLSDFAGLIVFPLFIFFLIGKWKKHIFILTALLFVSWKSPYSQALISFANNIGPFQFGRVVDYSDLIALLVLPIGYYSIFKRTISFRHPVFKTLLIAFTLFCIIASETIEVRFKHNVNGSIPYELEGNYIIQYQVDKKLETDTISFIRIKKSKFLVLENLSDTLYFGHIIRKKGDYYMNQFDKEINYWAINGFRIKGDSIYNFENSIWGIADTAFVTQNFRNYKIEKRKDLERYLVDNQKRETLKAFDKFLNKSKGVLFKEIIEQSDTLFEEYKIPNSTKIQNLATTEIKLYPNPFSDIITIEHQFEMPISVQIINISGQIIQKTEIVSSPFNWDLSELEKGTYIILLYSNNENLDYSMKVIKK